MFSSILPFNAIEEELGPIGSGPPGLTKFTTQSLTDIATNSALSSGSSNLPQAPHAHIPTSRSTETSESKSSNSGMESISPLSTSSRDTPTSMKTASSISPLSTSSTATPTFSTATPTSSTATPTSSTATPTSTKTASSFPPSSTSPATTVTPPTLAGDSHPTQSTGTRSSGPIIGGVIGGIVFVALSAITAVLIIKRRRRTQVAPTPTVNPLLDNSHVTALAAQRDLSTKRPLQRLEGVITSGTGTATQNQNQTMPADPGPTLPQSMRDVESAMQRQMEMITMISERIAAIEAHQHGLEDPFVNSPPDYESRASV